jgi:hypothetical protein
MLLLGVISKIKQNSSDMNEIILVVLYVDFKLTDFRKEKRGQMGKIGPWGILKKNSAKIDFKRHDVI